MTGMITFVPSVHFSPTHRRRVREAIREVEPDLVAVELDGRRFERFDRDSSADPLRELPPVAAASYGLLRAFQRTAVRILGLDPERTDMADAIETASELDLEVALVDDPIAETLAALSRRVGPTTLPKTFVRMQFQTPQHYLDQLEVLSTPFEEVRSGDDVQPAIDAMRRVFPEVVEVFVDRRDRAMAERLHAVRREGHDVVAVIGAGHHNGVRDRLAKLEGMDADPAVEVPVRRPSASVTRIPID